MRVVYRRKAESFRRIAVGAANRDPGAVEMPPTTMPGRKRQTLRDTFIQHFRGAPSRLSRFRTSRGRRLRRIGKLRFLPGLELLRAHRLPLTSVPPVFEIPPDSPKTALDSPSVVVVFSMSTVFFFPAVPERCVGPNNGRAAAVRSTPAITTLRVRLSRIRVEFAFPRSGFTGRCDVFEFSPNVPANRTGAKKTRLTYNRFRGAKRAVGPAGTVGAGGGGE